MARIRPHAESVVKDFSAKVRWRKRYDRNPIFPTLQDKLAVRGYAESHGVSTAALLHWTNDPRTIPFNDLPPDHMIKATHGSGWNIVCKGSQYYVFGDGSKFSDSPLSSAVRRPMTTNDVVKTCQQWLDSLYSRDEWAYSQITPNIIIEELLKPARHSELMDFRLYTFDGQVKAINVGSASYRRENVNAFFDADWNPIELSRHREGVPAHLPGRPRHLADMKSAATRLGKGVDFVRIDMYDTDRGPVLGEMTLYPESGHRATPTHCHRFNTWLGQQWRMTAAQERQVTALNLATFAPDSLALLRSKVRRIRQRTLPTDASVAPLRV